MTREEIESGMERLAAGFMVPHVWNGSILVVETDCGTELLPDEFGDPTDHWLEEVDELDEKFVSAVLAYCEGGRIDSCERQFGWFCRLLAPGYLDCTETAGPFESEALAAGYLVETYDDGDIDCE